MPTTAGWATTAWTRALVDALHQDLAAWTMAATTTAATPGLALALAPLALMLTPRSATLPRSIATLVWTQRAAGTATTASTRLTSGMVATECAQRTATGRLRTGATWVPTQTAAGWATGARTRAWEDALHPWEDQSWRPVRTSAPT